MDESRAGDDPAAGRDPSREAGEVTLLLDAASKGSTTDRDRLLQIVYDELRVIARSHMRNERNDHTLGATELVNESYLRLFRVAGETSPIAYQHRHAFYKAAATAMRRILIDHARARAAGKRGNPLHRGRISLDLMQASSEADPHDLLSLDDALSRLEEEDERAASVVRLRFFGGRQIEEIADMLGVTGRTIKRDWEFARARLQQIIEGETADPSETLL
ncbi:MAG: sigma-70 family RNA polymerase sigma factor [Phycisphaerales bacterium]|nr:MAG: sigma-70 family RNA polymerase sigma factor [Phycisphaerales bacterium]